MIKYSLDELKAELTTRINDPSRESFYNTINAIDALREMKAPRELLVRALEHARQVRLREFAPGDETSFEVLLLADSWLGEAFELRRQWLTALAPKVAFGPPGVKRRAWSAETRDRRRISLWAHLVSLNAELAPEPLLNWARHWVLNARLMRSRLDTCSHDVITKQRFGLTKSAQALGGRVLAERDDRGFWGRSDLRLTLRVGANLLKSGLVAPSELGQTRSWAHAVLPDLEGLPTGTIALVALLERFFEDSPVLETHDRKQQEVVEPPSADVRSPDGPLVFVSYSHKEVAFVRRLTRDLRAIGARIWLDENALAAGDFIVRDIRNALDASDYFLAVVSHNYNASHFGAQELDVAINLELNRGRPKVLVVLAEAAPLPSFLVGRLAPDMSTPRGYAAGLEKLARALGPAENTHQA